MPHSHPGVSLVQKTKGDGTWYLRFRDPRENGAQKFLTSRTTDFQSATRVAEELSRLIRKREHWDEPPEGLHPRTYKLWGARSLADRAKEATTELRMFGHADPAGFQDWDGNPLTREVLRDRWAALLERLKTTSEDRDQWRERALLAEGQLRKMGTRILRDASVLQAHLGDALSRWLAGFKGRDPDYAADVRFVLRAFARAFGEAKPLSALQGREHDLEVWLSGIKRKDGKPIGAARRVYIRRAVLRFLEDAGLSVDRKAVRRPRRGEVRRDRGPIRWLSREQALKVARLLPGRKDDAGYWQAAFRVQVGIGLRPDEIPTLKRGDFSEDLDRVTLSPLGELTLKNGSRQVQVPETLRPMLRERFQRREVLFPARDDKPWRLQKSFDRAFRSALRKAEAKAGAGRLDARIGRRTCATLLIAANVPILTVARILGDDLQTILEHYGGVIPGTLDPSKAAI